MPGKRAEDKRFIGWWAPAALRERLKGFTGRQADLTDTDVLNEALAGWLDKHDPETAETTQRGTDR